MYLRDINSTGNSNWQGDAFLIDLMRAFEPKTILDLGVGKWGKMGYLLRKNVDEWNYIFFKSPPLRIIGLEAWMANIHYVKTFFSNLYDDIVFANIDQFFNAPKVIWKDWVPSRDMPETFDIITACDVLEHLTDEEVLRLFPKMLERITGGIIIQLPLGRYEQKVEENPFETHQSYWDIVKIEDTFNVDSTQHKKFKIFKDFQGLLFVVFCVLK